jgi:hypothetical protein
LRLNRVEDDLQVLSPFFPSENDFRWKPVRHACTSTVEDDQSTERGQSFEEASAGRVFPPHVHIAHGARQVDDVKRAIAEDLIGDLITVTGSSILRLRGTHDLKSGISHSKAQLGRTDASYPVFGGTWR